MISIVRDITHVKQAEADKSALEVQLRKSQRMESIGTLAGGIAHDFNNILFPIIGRCEMLENDKSVSEDIRKHFQSILGSAWRASDLVRQILAFSRQQESGLTPVKVQDIIHEVVSLVRPTLPSNIDIVLFVNETCDLVMADGSQIHQVLMNLVSNAFHAMQPNGGKLEIGLNEICLGPENAGELHLIPGRYVDISVSDTGTGMEKYVIDRIFDPYFTTKDPGRGTGLGLSVSYGIVQKYHGAISVSSVPGEGSTFHVYLPIEKTGFVDSALEPGGAIRGGDEHILFVDDEFDIVETVMRILTGLGYRVTARTGSVDALEAFRNDPDRFDMLLTDMAMPNMTGVQLAAEVHKIRPDVPVILITGFSHQIDETNAKQFGIDAFLMKPVLREQLAVALRKVLDR